MPEPEPAQGRRRPGATAGGGAGDLVIVSNRGPVSFSLDGNGDLVTRRGGGGLVTALGSAVAGTGATWIAGALSDADREAASRGLIEAEGFRLRSLVVAPDAYRAYYDVIANGTLWFLHHGLWDAPRRPRYDRHWRDAWRSFVAVNTAFAETVVDTAPEAATVVVHDYHLPLLGPLLARERPDLATVHFSHTPFCSPDALRGVPAEAAEAVLVGMVGYGARGFHALRWARNFEACCAEVLGTSVSTFVSPAAADVEDIAAVAASEACAIATAALTEQVGDRRLVVRVDRIELSKNLLRGFWAYDTLLQERPEWREQVVFAACVYPSREGLIEYLAYRQEVEGLIRQVNDRWSTPGWTPILYDPTDDFPRSVAALRLYDVLLVNPVRDGLNLVAKEGPLVNERDGVLALSRESGVWEELGGAALEIHPFDVGQTADVLHAALSMGPEERREHSGELRRRAGARTPVEWLADQLAAAERSRTG